MSTELYSDVSSNRLFMFILRYSQKVKNSQEVQGKEARADSARLGIIMYVLSFICIDLVLSLYLSRRNKHKSQKYTVFLFTKIHSTIITTNNVSGVFFLQRTA